MITWTCYRSLLIDLDHMETIVHELLLVKLRGWGIPTRGSTRCGIFKIMERDAPGLCTEHAYTFSIIPSQKEPCERGRIEWRVKDT